MMIPLIFKYFPLPVPIEVSQFQTLTELLEETHMIKHHHPYPIPFDSLDFLETVDFLEILWSKNRPLYSSFGSKFRPIYLEVANFLDDRRFSTLIDYCRIEILRGQMEVSDIKSAYLEIILGPCRRKRYSMDRIARLLKHQTLRSQWKRLYSYFPLYPTTNNLELALIVKVYKINPKYLNLEREPEEFQLTQKQINRLMGADRHQYLQWALRDQLELMIRYLVRYGKLTSSDIRIDHNRVLRWAVAQGDLKLVKYLAGRFKLKRRDARAHNNEALRQATKQGHLKMVRFLVQYFGLTPTDARSYGNGALRQAAAHGHLEVVKFLVSYFKLNRWDARAHNNEALRRSAYHGYLEMVRYLVEHFVLTQRDVRSKFELAMYKEDRKLEALHRAAAQGHLAVVQYLVEYFPLKLPKGTIYSILGEAAVTGQLEVIEYLVDYYQFSLTSLRSFNVELLFVACCHGQLKVVRYLTQKFSLRRKDFRRLDNWPLVVAANYGYLEVIKYLVNYFELRAADFSTNNYALFMALENDQIQVAKYLQIEFRLSLAGLDQENCQVVNRVSSFFKDVRSTGEIFDWLMIYE